MLKEMKMKPFLWTPKNVWNLGTIPNGKVSPAYRKFITSLVLSS